MQTGEIARIKSEENTSMPMLPEVIYLRILHKVENFLENPIQANAQELIDILCFAYKCPACQTIFVNRNQRFHKIHGNIIHALYWAFRDEKNHLIEVWRRTTKGKNVSRKYLLRLLAHEFIHHYDWHVLEIDIDHDKGFKSRLDCLFSNLCD